MTRQFSSTVLAICLAGATTTGQSASSQAKPAPGGETVLSGCLLDSRADTTTADAKGVIYILDVAEAAAAKGTSASSGAERAAAVAKTRYALSTEGSGQTVDLAAHVGHHVELTGRVLPRPKTGGAGASEPAAAPDAKPFPGAAHRLFQVSALKMIAAKCP